LIDNVDGVWWYAKDVFSYDKDGKEYEINLNKEVKNNE
jgi:hypothetical protein